MDKAPRAVTLQGPTTMARPINGDTQRPGSQAITSISGFRRSSAAVATSREGHRQPRSGRGGQQRKRGKTKIIPRLAKPLQVLIGLLRPHRVERLRHLRGSRVALRPLGRDVSEGASSAGLAWLDRLPIILSVNAWSVVAASVHSRASLRYSSRCRVSSVSSAALTQFSAWYS